MKRKTLADGAFINPSSKWQALPGRGRAGTDVMNFDFGWRGAPRGRGRPNGGAGGGSRGRGSALPPNGTGRGRNHGAYASTQGDQKMSSCALDWEMAQRMEEERKIRQNWKPLTRPVVAAGPAVDPEAEIKWTAKQIHALKRVRTMLPTAIMGEGGSGKTALMMHIKAECLYNERACEVTGLTGIVAAAQNGSTLHSWARVFPSDPVPYNIDSLVSRINAPWNAEVKARLTQPHMTLLVDEIMMCSARLFEAIDAMLRRIRRDNRPFGGIQLIVFGDPAQLTTELAQAASSTNAKNMEPEKHLFDSKVWQECFKDVDSCIHMTASMRHRDDPEWAALLRRARVNRLIEADHKLLESRVNLPGRPPIRPTELHCYRKDVLAVNTLEMKALAGKTWTFQASHWIAVPVSASATSFAFGGSSQGESKRRKKKHELHMLDAGLVASAYAPNIASKLADIEAKTKRKHDPELNLGVLRDASELTKQCFPGQAGLNAEHLSLRINAEVVFTKNFATRGIFNGTRGVIVGVGRKPVGHGFVFAKSNPGQEDDTDDSDEEEDDKENFAEDKTVESKEDSVHTSMPEKNDTERIRSDRKPVVLWVYVHSNARPDIIKHVVAVKPDIARKKTSLKNKKGWTGEHDRREHEQQYYEWDNYVCVVQYPLLLAFALTVHRAQGMTLQSVSTDLSNGKAFASGQVYTLLSRCRSLSGLYLKAYSRNIWHNQASPRFLRWNQRMARRDLDLRVNAAKSLFVVGRAAEIALDKAFLDSSKPVSKRLSTIEQKTQLKSDVIGCDVVVDLLLRFLGNEWPDLELSAPMFPRALPEPQELAPSKYKTKRPTSHRQYWGWLLRAGANFLKSHA